MKEFEETFANLQTSPNIPDKKRFRAENSI
jgi:hypothetical protein